MTRTALRPVAFLATCLLAGTSHASLLVNGGFEAPAQSPGGFSTYGTGGAGLSPAPPADFAWKVQAGTIDLGSLPVDPFVQFNAYEGNQAIDLNGDGPGDIFQDFATAAGQRYALRFAYADNPVNAGVSSASVTVSNLMNGDVSGSPLLLASIVHSTSTNGPSPNGDWTLFGGSFMATGTSTRLRFTSTSDDRSASGGVLLDDVSVDVDDRVDVPAPAGLALLGAALALLGRRPRARS